MVSMSDLGVFEKRLVKARQVITRRGDPGKRVYVVVDGSIQVSGRGDQDVLGPGRFFGRLDMLTGDSDSGGYTQTATALTDSTVMFAEASQLREEIGKANPTARALIDHALGVLA